MARGQDKYATHVEPYLKEISMMALSMTEEQIAKTLGIGYSTFRSFKKQHQQLEAALKSGRRSLVFELKSALIQKAKGYEYTETKTVEANDGYKKVETYKKHASPDVAAINLLLKNYDKDNWRNDPAEYELKKKALELKEKHLESEAW